MFAAQLGLAFAIWVGIGLWAWFMRARWTPMIDRWSRTRRIATCMATLVASTALLLMGLLQLQDSGALQSGKLSTVGVIIATLIGAVFVLGEVFAVTCMLSLAQESVTKPGLTTSDREEGKKEL